MKLANEWKEYKILDMANGQKLEKWGNVVLSRPDPQIIWKNKSFPDKWNKINATYHRSKTGGGAWEFNKKVPSSWQIHYKNLIFNIKPMGFKHTGLFPEQAVNWDWMINKIKSAKRPIKVLNLFAYTGGATVACLSAGASVCHVDSSKGMVSWAKENVTSSKLADRKVRYIIDDVVKFVQREIRRGNKYDAIIMDPPSYGRGPKGEVWQIEEKLFDFVNLCMKVLSDKPLFFLINSYTTGFSPIVLENVLQTTIGKNFFFAVDEMNEEAEKIHGFSLEKLYELSNGMYFEDSFEEFLNDFIEADFIIGHNVQFDIKFLKHELLGIGEEFFPQHIFCTMQYYKDICKLLKSSGDFKNPKLEEVINFLNVSKEKITETANKLFMGSGNYHDARFDTAATYLAVTEGIKQGHIKRNYFSNMLSK